VSSQFLRFIVNGVVATAVHFSVLVFCVEVAGFPSAALANAAAAVFGIAASFLGNRYFVFAKTGRNAIMEAARFGGLYAAIALFHGLSLLVWTDWLGFDYRVGFALATAMQVSLSYLGNKYIVFR
jgi:putative flippase GtrA